MIPTDLRALAQVCSIMLPYRTLGRFPNNSTESHPVAYVLETHGR